MEWLRGKKTYIISALMACVGLVDMVTTDLSFSGVIDFITSGNIQTLLEAAGLSSLRAGIAKMMVK